MSTHETLRGPLFENMSVSLKHCMFEGIIMLYFIVI
jgi:hypothetical protein